MSTTVGGIRIVDMPDLGVVTDDSSVVGEHAGSGRFSMPALKSYMGGGGGGALSIKDFGARSDGATDDSAAFSAGIAAVVAMPLGGKLIIPAGRTVLANGINAVVPTGKTVSIEGLGAGTSELYFVNPTNGLNFQLATTGGVHVHGLSIIRGPTFPAIADTGLYIGVDSGPMYAGTSSLRDLVIRGSQTAAQINQWQNSLVLAAVSGTSIDNVTLTGINSTATDTGDVLCILEGGPAASQYGVSYNIINCVMVGASAGVDVRGWVQGVFIDNSTIIGQYDSIRWIGGGPYAAEELAVSNCTLNGGHRGFWASQVNQCAVSNTTVLHFNTHAPAGFAGIEINQSGFNSVIGNNIIGANTGTEIGILISDCGQGPNTIAGNLPANLTGAGIWLKGNSNYNTVTGNNLTGPGAVPNGIVEDTSGNVIVGNQWDGLAVPNSSMLVSDYLFLTSPTGPSHVVYERAASPRWFVGDDGATESGSNSGSNYEIVAAGDTGTILGAPIRISRQTGNVTFNNYGGTDLNVVMSGPAGINRFVDFSTTGASRWFAGADGSPESTGNAGSNFVIVRAADGGAIIGSALTISRATGYLSLGVTPPNYTNDAAAAAGGIIVGGIYRNGSALMVRVA